MGVKLERAAKRARRLDAITFLKSIGIDQRLNHTEERRRVLVTFFGGRCKRCGFDDIRALQIDHVRGDGYKHVGGWSWLLWDISQQPEKYQCLCSNCNWIKRAENNESQHRGARVQRENDWIDEWIAANGKSIRRHTRRRSTPIYRVRNREQILASMKAHRKRLRGAMRLALEITSLDQQVPQAK